jgi:hypothetical protein
MTDTRLPEQSFGPYSFNEMRKELMVFADMSSLDARTMVLDAFVKGEVSV